MKTSTTTKKQLIKKFHVLLRQHGVDNETKAVILAGYGIESSVELSVPELIDLCNTIEKEFNKQLKELDQLRKRVIAAIGGYLRALHRDENIQIIKAIACRATEYDNFNKIPTSKLRAIYGEFTRQTKAIKGVKEATSEMLFYAEITN